MHSVDLCSVCIGRWAANTDVTVVMMLTIDMAVDIEDTDVVHDQHSQVSMHVNGCCSSCATLTWEVLAKNNQAQGKVIACTLRPCRDLSIYHHYPYQQKLSYDTLVQWHDTQQAACHVLTQRFMHLNQTVHSHKVHQTGRNHKYMEDLRVGMPRAVSTCVMMAMFKLPAHPMAYYAGSPLHVLR